MKYYFHLTNGFERIVDYDGVEAESSRDAEVQALTAIQELTGEDPEAATCWSGWRMELADEAGATILVMDLNHQLLISRFQ